MSTMRMAASSRRTWRVPRPALEDWLFIAACAWGVMLLAVPVVGSLIDHWAWIVELFGREVDDISVTGSIWGPMSGIAVWFVGFVGGYYLHYHVPACVANGQTRRDAAIGAAVFGGVLAVVSGVLITIGFAYEHVVYAIAGWQRGTPDDMVYDSFNDYGQILLVSLFGMVMWVIGGAMIGGSFYRSNERGLISVVVAIAMVSLVGGNGGLGGSVVFLARRFDLAITLGSTLLLAVLASLVLGGIAWWNVRSLPLRNK